jgi:hypothetical protein
LLRESTEFIFGTTRSDASRHSRSSASSFARMRFQWVPSQ